MDIEETLEGTAWNAAAAGFMSLGVAALFFAAGALAGLIVEIVTGDLVGGDVAVSLLAGVTAILVVGLGASLIRAASGFQGRFGEQRFVTVVIVLGIVYASLGVLFVVSAFAGTMVEGDLALGALLVMAGLLALVAGHSYRSMAGSVAATGAIFGVASAAVLVAVQVVGSGVVPLASWVGGLVRPALLGVVSAVSLIVLGVGGLLWAFLWDTDWSLAAGGTLFGAMMLFGLGALVEGIGALMAFPWRGLAEGSVESVVSLVGVGTGLVLFTVAGFLFLAGAGVGLTGTGKQLYARLAPAEDGGDALRPGRGWGRRCGACGGRVAGRAVFCPSCGERVGGDEA